MASDVTDYGADLYAAALFGLGGVPSAFYIALCSDHPDMSTDGYLLAGIELSGGNYARQMIPTGGAYWNGPYSGTVVNANDITWPNPNADWGNAVSYALCDAATGGNVILVGDFDDPKFIGAGTIVTMSAGSLSFNVTSYSESMTG